MIRSKYNSFYGRVTGIIFRKRGSIMVIKMAGVKCDSFVELKKIFEEDNDLRQHCWLRYSGSRISGGLEIEIQAGCSKLEPKVLGLIAEHVRS